MDLQIAGKNLEINKAVRIYVERKIGKFTRYLPDISQGEVEISQEMTKSPEQRYVVQVTLNHEGAILRGEERAVQLYAAIDKVAEVMERQVERYKGRMQEKIRVTSAVEREVTALEDLPHKKVVKVKRFTVKPMSLDEAIEQMELLGHDFFLFADSSTGKINLLYRRRDEDYGLIQPELG